MRFAKRNRGWLSGRRLFGDGRDVSSGAVATDERRALLEMEDGGEGGGAGYREGGVSGDPTQHLLTALGRFQLQVARAEAGTPQEQWCDDCMNQIITGIELSVDQGWDNVMQALTDTARILHSYEKAEQAAQCVPFLQDSYEILCLMVGDIIVDNVRSGVMHKWKERYQRAVDDLLRAGIPLVEDDEFEDDEEPAPAPRTTTATAKAQAPELEPREVVYALPEDALPPSGEIESGDETEGGLDEAYGEDDASPFEEPPDESQFAEDATNEDTGANLPALDELLGIDETDKAGEGVTGAGDDVDAAAGTPDTVQPANGSLMEELFPEEAPPPKPVSKSKSKIAHAAQDTLWGPEPAPESSPPADAAPEKPAPSVSPQPVAAPPNAAIEPAAAVPATTSSGAAEAEELLRTTQKALSSGNVADAKVLALELAVSMARLEVERSEAQVRGCENRLTQNESAIADAEDTVNRCAQGLSDAESRVVDNERELNERRQQLDALRERIGGIETGIADIEAKIRELQAQRDAELAKLEAAEKEQDDAFAMESRIQTEIEQLNETCQAAQESLEDARDEVSRLKHERSEHEAELKEALTALTQRRLAVEQINQTIESIRGGSRIAEKSAPNEVDQQLF